MSYFNRNGTGSLSLWLRSADFDTKLKVYDPDNVLIVDNDDAGWSPSPDQYNSAANITASKIGNYTVIVDGWGPYNGLFRLYVSPGAELEYTWAENSDPKLTYISSSGYLALDGALWSNGSYLIIYDPINNVVVTSSYEQYYMGMSVYSPVQDRLFQARSGSAHIFEYDKNGSYIASYPVDPVGKMQSPALVYDSDKDQIGVISTGVASFKTFYIWDCATRALVQQRTVDLLNGVGFMEGAYSSVNQKYYLSHGSNGLSYISIDANTYVSASIGINQTNGWTIRYIPETELLVVSRGKFIDPTSNTLVHNETSFGGTLEGVVYDPCAETTALIMDMTGGTGIACFSSSFEPMNYIHIQEVYDNSYAYDAVFALTNSKVYTVLKGDTGSSLWSTKISIPTGSIILPAPPFPSCGLTLSTTIPVSGSGGAVYQENARGLIWNSSTGELSVIDQNTNGVLASLTNTYITGSPIYFLSNDGFYALKSNTTPPNSQVIRIDSSNNVVSSCSLNSSSFGLGTTPAVGQYIWAGHVDVNDDIHLLTISPYESGVYRNWFDATPNPSPWILDNRIVGKSGGANHKIMCHGDNLWLSGYSGSNNYIQHFIVGYDGSTITASHKDTLDLSANGFDGGMVYSTATSKAYFGSQQAGEPVILEVDPATLSIDYVYTGLQAALPSLTSVSTILSHGSGTPRLYVPVGTGSVLSINPSTRTLLCVQSLPANAAVPGVFTNYARLYVPMKTGSVQVYA